MTWTKNGGAEHLPGPADSTPYNSERRPASPGAALLAVQPELARFYALPELDHQASVMAGWLLTTAKEAERGTL